MSRYAIAKAGIVGPKKRMAECHLDRPHWSKGLCVDCYAAQIGRGRQNAYYRASWFRKYGLAAGDYERMVEAQGGEHLASVDADPSYIDRLREYARADA